MASESRAHPCQPVTTDDTSSSRLWNRPSSFQSCQILKRFSLHFSAAIPRLAFSSPHIPHSPSLSAYQFSEGASPNTELYGDLGSDSVDWLVNDDTGSVDSSSVLGDGTLNGAAAEWIQPQTVDMGPYDMLRSILRDERPDEEIERALEASGYDLSAALIALMGSAQTLEGQQMTVPVPEPATFHIGKSMSPAFRPATPAGQSKSNIICKYYMSSGSCARADCRFSHDTSRTLCK